MSVLQTSIGQLQLGEPSSKTVTSSSTFFDTEFSLIPSSALTTGTNASSASIIVTEASNAPVTITESGSVNTITITPTNSPSLVCPSANGSTYTANNKPLPTIGPQWNWHITNTSLFFEILCFTHYVAQDSLITDLQIFANISSLNDCLDLCALFNFNARLENFPALGCTGIALGTGAGLQLAGDPWHTCWLKSNVTMRSLNDTAAYPGYDGAVLLNI